MPQLAEVGIVGAGPAGAQAAALLAGQGVDVVAFDPRVPWEKPCGGGMTSLLFEEFPEFRELQALAHPVHRARIELDPETGFEVELNGAIWMISRKALGRWQLDRALEAGVKHQSAKVRAIERTRGGWVVDTDRGAWRVSYLVGADGAASRVRPVVAPGLSIELVPGRVAYPSEPEESPDCLVLRFFGGRVGYLWDFPRPGHHSIGIEMASGSWRRAELDGKIDEYMGSSESDRCSMSPRAGAVIGTGQLHGRFSRIAGHDFALCGDAAGFADPFTGEGIRNALRSAQLLARAWSMGGERRAIAYSAFARKAFAGEFTRARLLRLLMSESGLGVRLVKWGVESDIAYAAVGAVLGVATDHDYRLTRLLSLWYRGLKSGKADPGRREAKSTRVAAPNGRAHAAC